jgi:RNA polymerase sigma-70 factor (ECF subfamily)
MDQTQFHQLYRTYGPAVRSRLRAMCGNDAEADDVLQEAFLKAWRARSRFDGRNPLGWLHVIARNVALDRIRRRRPWAADPTQWLERVPSGQSTNASRLEAVRLLDEFGAEDAVLLRLRHAEGWRIHEIAEHFETSQRTVRRRLERVEKRARALLGLTPEVCVG